ncbi:MAG TPA: pantoate--beta-alanine ligase [Chitinophagaceae bacterium]|nr:pantoate--beta-alanine ligase [Chitinophagaceae bacterium]
MILLKNAADLRKWLESQREAGKIIGFVPTMGALHDGHLSLIGFSKKDNDVTVASIFVNPAQFNDPGDFEKYPVTIEKDINLLEKVGCDVLFLPSVNEIYPHGVKAAIHYDLGFIETVLEGKFRPGHFQGVCMVVHRLLEIVQPHKLYLGQKDYQQCMVITRLIELINQKEKIIVKVCPTHREKDGLAMSSRNMRLRADERIKATGIYQCLSMIKENLKTGSLQKTKENAMLRLEKSGFKVDYVEVVDATTLQSVDIWDGKQKLVGLVAAFLNEVRLIDNKLLN